MRCPRAGLKSAHDVGDLCAHRAPEGPIRAICFFASLSAAALMASRRASLPGAGLAAARPSRIALSICSSDWLPVRCSTVDTTRLRWRPRVSGGRGCPLVRPID